LALGGTRREALVSEVWQKRLLLVAAAWNVLGGASALFDPTQHFAQLYKGSLMLSEPLQLFFYRCTWINVVAWGVAYLLAAMLPASRTVVFVAGGAGKVVYFAACLALFLSDIGKRALLATGVVDLLLAAFFFLAVLWRRPAEPA
jgi:hypothetical protein